MQRFHHDDSGGYLSDLTKSVGVSRELSERLTKVSESHDTCRKHGVSPNPAGHRTYSAREPISLTSRGSFVRAQDIGRNRSSGERLAAE